MRWSSDKPLEVITWLTPYRVGCESYETSPKSHCGRSRSVCLSPQATSGGVADQSGTYSRGERPDCNSIPTVTGETPIATPGVGGFQWFTNNGNFTTPTPGILRQLPKSTWVRRWDRLPVLSLQGTSSWR
jgi:hypothetical protein